MKRFIPIIRTIFFDNRLTVWPRYSLRAVAWQIRKKLGHSFNTILDNGAMVRVHPSTAYSGIFYARNPEGNDMLFLRRHASLASTFVDVGLNVDLFSASMFDVFTKEDCLDLTSSSFIAHSEIWQ